MKQPKERANCFRQIRFMLSKLRRQKNHKKGSERRDTYRSKRQFSSKSTEDKKSFYTCFSCGENTANTGTRYIVCEMQFDTGCAFPFGLKHF